MSKYDQHIDILHYNAESLSQGLQEQDWNVVSMELDALIGECQKVPESKQRNKLLKTLIQAYEPFQKVLEHYPGEIEFTKDMSSELSQTLERRHIDALQEILTETRKLITELSNL
jgi:hypothetical protein